MSKNGSLAPCPSYNGQLGSISEVDDLQKFFQADPGFEKLRQAELSGKWDLPGCSYCANYPEASAKVTFNNFMNNHYPDCLEPRPELNHMEIDFGNYCNLDCVMCSSEYSTKWLSDDISFNESAKGQVVRPVGKPWRLSERNVEQILELCATVESIHIKGGEPFLEKNFVRFLEGLLERDQREHYGRYNIVVVTNFVLMNDRLAELLSKFQRPVINISLDGIDSTYNWIRGTDFKAVEALLRKYLPQIPEAHVVFNFTASVYNIHQLEAFYTWAAQLKKDLGVRLTIQYGPVVKYPRYLVPALSPRRQEALEQIERLLTDPLKFTEARGFYESLEALRDNLKVVPEHLERQKKSFHLWHDHLVKKRGWNYQEAHPL